MPPACEKELARLVALVPDADLAALAATEPAFQKGGFRAGNIPALRARLRQLVCGGAEIPDALRRLLARRSRSRTLTGLLSPDAIAESRHALAALLGDPVLLVALLLDARPEIRAKAEEWLQQPFAAQPPDAAAAQLREIFGDLAQLLGGGDAAAPAPVTREAWMTQKEKLEGRLRDLQTENRRLKGAEDRLAGAKNQLKTCQEQLDAAARDAKATETALRQKTRELEAVSAELARETSRREERLLAAIDLALAKEFHGWLARARAVEDAAAHPAAHGDLLAQAEAALRKQAETDRHSGNRAALGERLEQLKEALKKVRSALRDALRRTPELQAVETALAAEIRRLDALLEPDAPASPLEEALAPRIHAARDNDLPRLRELPDLFASLQVLDDAAVARLRQAFQRRLAAVEAAGVELPPTEGGPRPPGAALLSRALTGGAPAILLVDGHNALFGLPSRYNPARGASLTEAEKRQLLTNDIARIAAPNPALRVWIVFDGPTRSDTQAAPNVRVTYSGGQGEHRADGVLLDNIRFFKSASPEIPVILASNDQGLCAGARRLGAFDLPVMDLGGFFLR
jgi:predicted  nucleic acid-binding Zn-ribbon protein